MKKIIFPTLLLILFSNLILAEEFSIYEDDEISLSYPSDWVVYELTKTVADKNIVFTAPEWTEEEGGTIISYSLISFPESYDTFKEKNKEKFVEGFLKPMKETYETVTVDSSEIISVGEFTALKIDLITVIQSIILKQRSIIIADGDRYHMLSYGSSPREYNIYLPVFNSVIDSFKIKKPHEAPFGYVNLANQKTFLLVSFIILLSLALFGIYKIFKTRKNKTKSEGKNIGIYKNIAKKANISMWISMIGDLFFGIDILLYLVLISIFTTLICSIVLIDTKERKFAKSNLYYIIFLLGVFGVVIIGVKFL